MKSKITRITYAEVKNLGDYETARVEAEAVVVPGDSPGAVMRRLKKWVAIQIDEGPYYEEGDDEVDA